MSVLFYFMLVWGDGPDQWELKGSWRTWEACERVREWTARPYSSWYGQPRERGTSVCFSQP